MSITRIHDPFNPNGNSLLGILGGAEWQDSFTGHFIPAGIATLTGKGIQISWLTPSLHLTQICQQIIFLECTLPVVHIDHRLVSRWEWCNTDSSSQQLRRQMIWSSTGVMLWQILLLQITNHCNRLGRRFAQSMWRWLEHLYGRLLHIHYSSR